VSSPGSQAGGATTSRNELRGLTREFSGRKALDGPAMRPITLPAAENGVGTFVKSTHSDSQKEKSQIINNVSLSLDEMEKSIKFTSIDIIEQMYDEYILGMKRD
jgi:hypothetical protein